MQRYQAYHSVSKWLKALSKWENAPSRITADGEIQVYAKGNWVSKAEFDAHNPKPVYEKQPNYGLDGKPIERILC